MNKQNESIFPLIRRETTVKEDKKKRKPESFIITLTKRRKKRESPFLIIDKNERPSVIELAEHDRWVNYIYTYTTIRLYRSSIRGDIL
jgi:hypothetical protein